jgi:hypothetical protein
VPRAERHRIHGPYPRPARLAGPTSTPRPARLAGPTSAPRPARLAGPTSAPVQTFSAASNGSASATADVRPRASPPASGYPVAVKRAKLNRARCMQRLRRRNCEKCATSELARRASVNDVHGSGGTTHRQNLKNHALRRGLGGAICNGSPYRMAMALVLQTWSATLVPAQETIRW